MSDTGRPEVTRAMVEDLWDRALTRPSDRLRISERAEHLLMQVNSENPVVNWGLTDLYYLAGSPATTTDDLASSRARWLAEVERYESGPALWTRTYLQRMARDFAATHGTERGRAFAAKLVRGGQLSQLDLPMDLRE